MWLTPGPTEPFIVRADPTPFQSAVTCTTAPSATNVAPDAAGEGTPPLAATAARAATRRQRLENARRINSSRAVVSFALAVLFWAVGRVAGVPDWQGGDWVFLGHCVGANFVYWLSKRSERFALSSSYVVGLWDAPAIAVLELVLLATAPNPAELVAFDTATMLTLVAGATLWMDPRPILVAAASAAALQSGLQVWVGGHPSYILSTFALFGVHAAICAYGAVRLRQLVSDAALRSLELRRTEESLQAERQRLEERLRAYAANFHQLMEEWPDASFMHREGHITRASRQFATWLGFSQSELHGWALAEFLHPDDRERFEAAAERGAPCEVRLRTRSGEQRAAELLSRAVVFDGSSYTLTVARDLTERRALQAQLMAADRMASMGLLAAGVAHEINTPLAVIAANLAHLEPAFHGPESAFGRDRDLAGALEDALEATQRVREIVGDLRLFSRGDEDQRRAVSVRDALESALRLAWNEIRHRAELRCSLEPVPDVMASESRLGQVFLNLLTNAAHAIPVGQLEKHEIAVSTRTDDQGFAVIEIRDTGSGIPEGLVSRVFDPFFTTKPAGIGTGLGLAICRRIVADLGGRIDVESELGRGSCFRVFLPPTSEARKGRFSHRPPPAAVRGKILVVDDDPAICRTVKRVLSAEHDVTALTHPGEALERALHDDFDVVLCDLMMPVMTGIEFYARVSAAMPALAQRIIFLSGGALNAEARAFADGVPNRFLEKPFDIGTLRTMIGRYIADANKLRAEKHGISDTPN